MKKKEFVRRVARELQLTPADAADRVDTLVNEIRRRTRKGRAATIPGLGAFLPGPGDLSFESTPPTRRPKAR